MKEISAEALRERLEIKQMKEQDPLNKYIEAHTRKFGIEPNFIGRVDYGDKAMIKALNDSLIKGIPYDEYEMLNDEEKKEYDEGVLIID